MLQQQNILYSQSKLGNELESYTNSANNIMNESIVSLEQIVQKIQQIANIPQLDLNEILKTLMSLQEVGNSKAEIAEIKQQILKYPSDITYQLDQAQQEVKLQLDKYQNQISDHITSFQQTIHAKYIGIIALVICLTVICCTFFASRNLYTTTQELSQLNIIIAERHSELEKFRSAIHQAQTQLSNMSRR